VLGRNARSKVTGGHKKVYWTQENLGRKSVVGTKGMQLAGTSKEKIKVRAGARGKNPGRRERGFPTRSKKKQASEPVETNTTPSSLLGKKHDGGKS